MNGPRETSRVRVRSAVIAGVAALAACLGPAGMGVPADVTRQPPGATSGLLRSGDRVLIVGSSSTRIGVWPRTLEFLLRTRHPGLVNQFHRHSAGGGTFATALEHLDTWLGQTHPSVVIFNFGVNDSEEGEKGLERLRQRMAECARRVQSYGARVIFITPQASDSRKATPQAASLRALYADAMLAFGRQQGWPVIDVYRPLDLLLRSARQVDPGYTILRDQIHLTAPAYVAWGFFFYDRLDLPPAASRASLTAEGEVTSTENCEIRDVSHESGSVSFTRVDRVLPILPPVALPPRFSVPLESHSRYMLQVTGLEFGEYEVRCERQLVGYAKSPALAAGVNLNSLVLDRQGDAPWRVLAQVLWDGTGSQRVGHTPWRFEIRRRGGKAPESPPSR